MNTIKIPWLGRDLILFRALQLKLIRRRERKAHLMKPEFIVIHFRNNERK